MSPGMIVRPRTSMTSASCGHDSAPRAPATATRSPSTTTAASGTGAAPVPSVRVAPVNTRIIASPSLAEERQGEQIVVARSRAPRRQGHVSGRVAERLQDDPLVQCGVEEVLQSVVEHLPELARVPPIDVEVALHDP